jgi:hypothetical protein
MVLTALCSGIVAEWHLLQLPLPVETVCCTCCVCVTCLNSLHLQEFGSNSLNLDSSQQAALLDHVFTLRTAASMAISQPVQEVLNVSDCHSNNSVPSLAWAVAPSSWRKGGVCVSMCEHGQQ